MTISVSQKQLARKSASICIEQVGGWVGVAKLGSRWHRMIKVSEETLLHQRRPSQKCACARCAMRFAVRNMQIVREYYFKITITD